MAHHRFTPEQIATKLEAARRLEAQRVPVSQICRELGIAELTYLRWHKKYAALDADSASRLRNLEEENARLRRALDGLRQVVEDLTVEFAAEADPVPRLSAVASR